MDAAHPGKLPKLYAAFASVGDKLPVILQERYPRIAEKMEELWGTREAMPYLDGLLLSDRGERHGFSDEVLRELTYLKQLHEYEFPELSRDPFDPFSSASFTLAGLKDSPAGAAAPAGADRDRAAKKLRERHDVAAKGGAPAVAEPDARVPWSEIFDPGQLRQIVDERKKGLVSPAKDTRRIGEILVGNGLLKPEMLARALKLQQATRDAHEPLGHILVRNGLVAAADLTFGLCQQAGIPIVDPVLYPVDHEAEKRVPADVAHSRMAVPVAQFQNTLFLAVADPFSFADRQYFSFLTNLNVELVAAASNKLILRLNAYGQVRSTQEADKQFRQLAKKAFHGFTARNGAAQPVTLESTRITEEDATIVGLVNKMIGDAIAMGASDIHIEAFHGRPLVRIRFRRDGVMEVYSEYQVAYREAVVSRIKIMADLDIAERRKPQDGKISFPVPGRQSIDLRVVTIPTANGIENITIRLLSGGEPLPIDRIGLAESDLSRLRELIVRPYGLFLVCGPTGSGKTTTLHSVLRELNTDDRKIWTAEDPVEIVQRNICQVQVNRKVDWTFAAALRTFLRADPDVIMIGEMRDIETAHIAVEASMTGHLVLSTLHTNSAAETAARLLDLGMDPFNLSDAILGILAQRLARSVCSACGTRVELSNQELYELAAESFYSVHQRNPSLPERDSIISSWHARFATNGKLTMHRATGCSECNKTGYRGRTALFELLVVTPAIRALIRNNASVGDFLKVAVGDGMRTLKQDGIEKILLGKTDLLQVRGACT
jgi:type II secretory ATPase GspE/PulE/Tfp pilus assembly ATPase PilB-like protein